MNLSQLSARRVQAGWGRAAVLTMLLLGILGMHVLAAHCSPSGGHGTEMAVVSAGPLPADHAEPTVMREAGGGGHSRQSPDHGTGDLGMAGICMVALVGLALALAMALVRRSRTLWRVPPRVWLRTPRPRSRLARPPTLAELSLLRC